MKGIHTEKVDTTLLFSASERNHIRSLVQIPPHTRTYVHTLTHIHTYAAASVALVILTWPSLNNLFGLWGVLDPHSNTGLLQMPAGLSHS